MQRLFDNGGIRDFLVKSVTFNDGEIELSIERKKRTIAEYCRNNIPKKIEFKHDKELYELEKFYINVDSHVEIVYAFKKYGKILELISIYECENPNLFVNKTLHMNIDEIIKEVL